MGIILPIILVRMNNIQLINDKKGTERYKFGLTKPMWYIAVHMEKSFIKPI